MRDEAKAIAERRIAGLEELGWDAALEQNGRDEIVTVPSGRRYRIKTFTFWDMEEWSSDLCLSVKVRPTTGGVLLRRLRGANGWSVMPGDLPPDWEERAARAKCERQRT